MDPENEIAEWESLSERQQEQAESYTELVLKFGMFDQTSGSDGAHYAPASSNPFKATGLMCKNCVFFDETNNQCVIVAGSIEAEAICKLWVIPENVITEADAASRSALELKKRKLAFL